MSVCQCIPVLHELPPKCRDTSYAARIKLFAPTQQPNAPFKTHNQQLYEHSELPFTACFMEFTDGRYMTMHTIETNLSTTVTNVSVCKTALLHQMECSGITDDVIKEASLEKTVS